MARLTMRPAFFGEAEANARALKNSRRCVNSPGANTDLMFLAGSIPRSVKP